MQMPISLDQMFRSQAGVNALQTLDALKFSFYDHSDDAPVQAIVAEYEFRAIWVPNSGAAGEKSIVVLSMSLHAGPDHDAPMVVCQFDNFGRMVDIKPVASRSGSIPEVPEIWASRRVVLDREGIVCEFDEQYEELIDNLMGHREVRVASPANR